MPVGVRTNNWSFNRCRNRLNAWLVAGWLRCRRSAARATLPSRRIASKTSSRFRSRERRFIAAIHFVHCHLQSMHFLQPAARPIKRHAERPAQASNASAAAVPPSREALQPSVRGASARRITMSVRKSITLLTLLLSVSAASFVATDVAGGFVARAALPPTISDLLNVRAAVADSRALVDKGDL